MKRAPPPETHHIALATAHPAKFAGAVDLSLKAEKDFSFDKVLSSEFIGLKKERRVWEVPNGAGWQSHCRRRGERRTEGCTMKLYFSDIPSLF